VGRLQQVSLLAVAVMAVMEVTVVMEAMEATAVMEATVVMVEPTSRRMIFFW
jgi:hypothetical protein